jgi:hypothetical protein
MDALRQCMLFGQMELGQIMKGVVILLGSIV